MSHITRPQTHYNGIVPVRTNNVLAMDNQPSYAAGHHRQIANPRSTKHAISLSVSVAAACG